MASFEIRAAAPGALKLLVSIDDDAAALYAQHGMPLEISSDSPFVRSEVARWQRALELGRVLLAVDAAGTGLGFAAMDVLDREPYLDQLAVRVSAMRRGIGGALMARGIEWARTEGGEALWLTTYGHLPFNRPYYERHGFQLVPEALCVPGVANHLAEQRLHLPQPSQRVAMRCPL